jgi:hypothetical protein
MFESYSFLSVLHEGCPIDLANYLRLADYAGKMAIIYDLIDDLFYMKDFFEEI